MSTPTTYTNLELPFLLNGKDLFKGHIDKFYHWEQERVGLVIDYKTLYGSHKDADENWQILCYCVQAMTKFDLVGCFGSKIQPRISQQIKPVFVTVKQALDIRERITDAWDGSLPLAAPRTPSIESCFHCKGLTFGVCKEACEFAMMSLSTIGEETLTRSPEQILASLPPEKRTELFDAFNLHDKLKKVFTTAVKPLATKDPEFVPGYKMYRGGEKNTVVDIAALRERIYERYGGNPQKWDLICSISNTKLKSAVKSWSGLKGRFLDAEVDRLLDGLVDRTTIADSFERV